MAAYNVAPYVVAAVESVLSQEWTDFEFIIVDDASTDGTREALLALVKHDPRIRLFLKDQNEGLAVARNLALREARGEWVTFLDADDLYDPQMLRLAIEAGRQWHADMVMWDYVVFAKETEIVGRKAVPSALGTLNPEDRFAVLDRPAFAWTRLVRRDALTRLRILFPPGLTYQDVSVHWRLVTQLDIIALVPQRLAYYRQQPHATTAGKGIKRADYFIVLDQVEAYLRETSLIDHYADALTKLQLNAWHGIYDVIAPEFKPRIRAMISERMTDRHRRYIDSANPLRWQARAFFRAAAGNRTDGLLLWLRSVARKIYRGLVKI